jgi:hypothetical protein
MRHHLRQADLAQQDISTASSPQILTAMEQLSTPCTPSKNTITYIRSQLIGMKLFDLRRNLMLGSLPLVGLVEPQPTMSQVASSAGALVSRSTDLAADVIQLSEQRGFGIVEDVDDGRAAGHV